ncbi:MAG: hypothetical protein J5789_05140 [Oscillospiraceae bacterium]|nr:hypothetical protein [Oscillospiraceae bacterium]
MSYRKASARLRRTVVILTLLLTGLRVLILQTSFDKNGLLPFGSIALPVTVLVCAGFFGVLWFQSARLNRLPGRENAFSVQGLWLPVKLIAAGLLLAGCVLALTELEQFSLKSAELLIPVAGAVSALLLGWNSLRERRGESFFWVRLVPAIFTGAALVLRFRVWSHDPMVIHILPSLLAWTCCMVEMMLLSGFSLNVGHRRSAVLFGLAAGMFACMTVPDYLLGESGRVSLPDLLTLLGVALWCFIAALELLRDRTQREKPAAGI